MQDCDAPSILSGLGLSFIEYVIPGAPPLTENVAFKDIAGAPANCNEEFVNFKLYKHQLETFKALDQEKNVVLTASTGSGKTEAWLLYALAKRKKVLALYPTKALANDQSHRIAKYYRCYGYNVLEEGEVVYGDVIRYDGDTKSSRKVSRFFGNAMVTITNPEMLLTLLKKGVPLPHFDLVVLDEVDFYESHSLSLLVNLIKPLCPTRR